MTQVSCAEICTPPLPGALPPPKEALAAPEVEDPSFLPFATADTGPQSVERRTLFINIIKGHLNDEAEAFLKAVPVEVCLYSRILYAAIKMVATGDQVGKRDFSKANFEAALDLLHTDAAWQKASLEGIAANFKESVPEAKAIAILAYTRFRAIAEEGYERKIFDRPFWILPPASEVREVSESPGPPLVQTIMSSVHYWAYELSHARHLTLGFRIRSRPLGRPWKSPQRAAP